MREESFLNFFETFPESQDTVSSTRHLHNPLTLEVTSHRSQVTRVLIVTLTSLTVSSPATAEHLT